MTNAEIHGVKSCLGAKKARGHTPAFLGKLSPDGAYDHFLYLGKAKLWKLAATALKTVSGSGIMSSRICYAD